LQTKLDFIFMSSENEIIEQPGENKPDNETNSPVTESVSESEQIVDSPVNSEEMELAVPDAVEQPEAEQLDETGTDADQAEAELVEAIPEPDVTAVSAEGVAETEDLPADEGGEEDEPDWEAWLETPPEEEEEVFFEPQSTEEPEAVSQVYEEPVETEPVESSSVEDKLADEVTEDGMPEESEIDKSEPDTDESLEKEIEGQVPTSEVSEGSTKEDADAKADEDAPATPDDSSPKRPTITAQKPSKRGRHGLSAQNVISYFAPCGRCGFFLSGYRALYGGDDLETAVSKSKGGWLTLSWGIGTRELLLKSFGSRIELTDLHFDGCCPECRRVFTFHGSRSEKKGPTFRIEIKPRKRQ
jgi:hypothetical protein